MKCTAVAPSNIAFIKYWGRKNEELRLPENGSISMNLSNLLTTTTVEFSKKYKEDQVEIYSSDKIGRHPERSVATDRISSMGFYRPAKAGLQNDKVIKHLDRVRNLAKINLKAKVVSKNNFPQGTGLSSSASGFAALTFAASNAAGLKLPEKELSTLARQGSGSACRSIPDGFVEWLDGDISETSYSKSIFPPDYWDIVDVVCILTAEEKDVSTTEGQKRADSSPFYKIRLQNIKNKIVNIKKAMREKDFKTFGEITEAEALELHSIMLTSNPSLIYWYPATIIVMKAVKKWRAEGLPVYFTVNTGQNIHVICEGKNSNKVIRKLSNLPDIKEIIVNKPSVGTYVSGKHLF